MYSEFASRTDRELIERVWDIEDIRDTMSRRVYMAAAGLRRQELDELWVSHPDNAATASFGRNWGYYIGMDSIRRYYAGPGAPASREKGYMSQHPVTTGLVELAGDGMTARGLWYCLMGQEARVGASGVSARWHNEKIAADLIREDGKWKIWHLVIATDHTAVPGEDQNRRACFDGSDLEPVRLEFGEPDIPLLTHDRDFNWWDDYPPPPKPYVSFRPMEGYGPEGHPALRRKEALI